MQFLLQILGNEKKNSNQKNWIFTFWDLLVFENAVKLIDFYKIIHLLFSSVRIST